LTIDYSVTRRALALGALDSITGWYAKEWANSTIEMPILKRGTTLTGLPIGSYAKYDKSGFTQDPIAEGDQIIDSFGNYYEVESVEDITIGDSLYSFECQLTRLTVPYDRPATSGTWHKDATLTPQETDVRYRTKYWMGTLPVTPITLYKDDGATQASYILSFANADYPIIKVFVNKGRDLIFSIDTGESEGLIQADRSAYGYDESVPIELFAINKVGITATNLIEQGYQELRRIAETYPTGSVRRTGRMTETTKSLGATSFYMFSQKYMLEYTREKVA
jgi:hypothetical protein